MPEEDLFDGSYASQAGDPDSRATVQCPRHGDTVRGVGSRPARGTAGASRLRCRPCHRGPRGGHVLRLQRDPGWSSEPAIDWQPITVASNYGWVSATSYGARWRRWDCQTGSSISSNRRDALRGAPPEPAVRTTRTCHRP